jgi:hypothetical protein
LNKFNEHISKLDKDGNYFTKISSLIDKFVLKKNLKESAETQKIVDDKRARGEDPRTPQEKVRNVINNTCF